jgi:hypothetical protein
MKTVRISTLARFTGMTLALALFGLTSANVAAQRAQDTAKGGGTDLLELNRPAKPALKASEYQPMSCAMCKDEIVTRVDLTTRGANKAAVLVAKHLCDSCATTISTKGHGKAKSAVVTHKCGSPSTETLACCKTKKDS